MTCNEEYPTDIEEGILRAFAECSQIPIFEFDMDLRLFYANRAGLRLLGTNESILRERPLVDKLLAREYPALVRAGIERILPGTEIRSISVEILSEGGQRVPIEVTAFRITRDGELCGYAAIAFDMTMRERRLSRESDVIDLLKFAVTHSRAGTLVVGTDYKFEYVNDRLCEMLGRTRDEILGTDFRRYVHPDWVKIVESRYIQRQKGEPVPPIYEFKIVRKNGEVMDVQIASAVTRTRTGEVKTVAQLIDITDVVKSREALVESEYRFRSLVETMTDGLAIDDDTGRIVYANDALARMAGYERKEELIGKADWDLFHGITKDVFEEKKVARMRGLTERYESHLIHKTGRLIPVVLSAAPLLDRHKNYVGSFAVVSDISGLRRAEEEARLLLNLLVHDIGNQLQLISNSIEMVGISPTPDQVRSSCDYISSATEKCLQIIRRVRELEQSRSEPLKPFDIVSELDNAVKTLAKLYRVKTVLKIERPAMIMADGAVGQLFWNLLENALKHNRSRNPTVWISERVQSDMVEISVADNGPGLSDEEKKSVFKNHKTKGLGLMIVNTLVDKYGGTLRVEDRIRNKPERGLKVVLRFPAVNVNATQT
ncbi:MAG: PAS domain-containing sensor histidine kinase [Candidatus Thorarchaeota archaeon]